MRGHFWTLAGHIGRTLNPGTVPPSRHLGVAVDDARFGSVRLSGRLSAPPSANSLLVLVHGLGGSSQSPYLFPATAAAHALGVATLRVSLRGADLRGEDFYHAGLTDDLRSYLAHPGIGGIQPHCVARLLLGGHLCLRYASEQPDRRVAAVSTLCAPLNLDLSSQAFDAARFGLYRHHVLKSLKAMYRQVTLRHDMTTHRSRSRPHCHDPAVGTNKSSRRVMGLQAPSIITRA